MRDLYRRREVGMGVTASDIARGLLDELQEMEGVWSDCAIQDDDPNTVLGVFVDTGQSFAIHVQEI